MGFFEKMRQLSDQELQLAKSVYQLTLTYDDINIGDQVSLVGAPWTEYRWIDEIVGEVFMLHMGPEAYKDCTSLAAVAPGYGQIRKTFIHELCHVWQGQHSLLHGSYQLRSALAQGCSLLRTGDRNNAYIYKAGQDWDSYNVEQQACIVEDWFAHGMRGDDPLYRYVRDNIRKG